MTLRTTARFSIAACASLLVMLGTAAPVKDEAEHLDRLSSDLAHPEFATREKATEQLWKMGVSALPKLRELARSVDPEQAVRARELVRKIELGVFPDSDPELLSIITRYPTATASEKSTLIRELQNRRAWRQMLKLYQEETNEAVIKQYLSTMQRIAVFAAREKLSEGDKQDALELLRLAPRTPSALMAEAHFHRVEGTLEQELELFRNEEGKSAADWRMALHRASGNMEAALANVDGAKQPELAAALAALNGDPIPWLQMRSQISEDDNSRRLSHQSRSLYARLAMDRWSGNAMNPEDFRKLTEMQENRSSQYRRVARTALFMLGANKTAEKSLLKDAPMKAAHYFLMHERVEEALQIMGHSIKKPCTEDWVREQLKGMNEDAFNDFDDSKEVQALCLMAGFLESRGLHDLAFECYRTPVLEFAQHEKPAFLDFVMKLFNDNAGFLPAPRLAIQLSVAWANDDEERWDQLTDAFWAGDDDSHEWWKLLGEIDPKVSRKKRLELVLVLQRRLPGEAGERTKWQDLIWKHYQKQAGEEKDDILRRLVDLAFNTGDVELGEKVWPIMPEDMRNSYFWRQQIAHLSARDNWKAVCEVLLEQVAMMEDKDQSTINPAFHAYAAAALRRAGRLKEAQEHDYKADLLCLGDSQMAMQIALAYAFGDDYERSRIWWARAAQSAEPKSSTFSISVGAFAESILFDPSSWSLVASLNEVAACESIDGSYYDMELPLASMRLRLKSDVCRALSRLEEDKRAAINVLEVSHRNYTTDGVLADFFFPVLRKADLIKEHDLWFSQSWASFTKVIETFPKSVNTKNTAAWFASRAQRQLDEAESHLRKALQKFPEQPAYLDTMAEIQFAKGKRKQSVEWSRKAILLAPADTELRRQYYHFRFDPLPK